MLQFAKKKRKRSDSGSDADLDFIEREEKEDEDLLDKRRSGRHSQRKKYVDDVQLDLSDDENLLMNLPPGMFRIVLTLQKHFLEFFGFKLGFFGNFYSHGKRLGNCPYYISPIEIGLF